ncbi:InlB B-repeat-containing protein [uncultured Oscillibacter sp.]|uniref:InlB B-repeat-containing protein n=1 Tax=uncultured Oscillibacter sp. TaxID=876091 RepID=UPI00345DD47A
MYYLLDPATGKYEYYGRSFYRASGSDSVPNDAFILSVGLYPYYAPPELINDGYTSTHDYYRTDEHSWVSGDTSKYTITYNFSPVLFGVTYQLDGTSYQTQNHYYQNTVAVLPVPAKTGYTFSGWSSGDITLSEGSFTMPAKNITIQGTYLIHSNALKYEYAGTVPKNAPPLPPGSAYNYGTTVNVASPPTVLGYAFGGWTSSNATLTGGSFIMPDNPVTITGIWTPRSDTPYTVERYQQNPDNDGYTLADTEHYTGTTDTVAVVPVKSYPGFSVTPESLTATSNVTIHDDGSTVLRLYYNRNVNTVTYAYSGDTDVTPPALPAATSYRYGQTVPVAVVPSLAGYDFGGWETYASVANGSFTMPDSAVSITGAWTARADTSYTVEYYQQNTENDGYTLAETLNGKGATGGSIPHREFVGFTQTLDSVTAEGNARIRSDGSTLLKLYYDRNVNSVSYSYSGEMDTAAPTLPIGGSYRYGQTVPMAAAPTLPGYNFGGWETADASIGGGSFTMPDAAVSITGAWTARTDTPYSVEYYQQNIVDDSYTLTDIEHCTGTTGGEAMVPGKSYPGFSVTPESTSAATNVLIKSNGSTLLKLYYDRNVNIVSYAYLGETDTAAPAVPVSTSYRFGQAVPVSAAPALPGYDFSGWETSDASIAGGSFTMPDTPVNITGAWTAKADTPYVVEYYQQNTDDDAYTLAFTFNGTGVTGTGVPHKEFEGFTQTPDSLSAEGSAKIRSDGSTVLKLYYDRNTETVTYTYSGETDVTPPELPSPASYRFGKTVPVAAAPSLAGYDFSGWTTSDAPVVDGSFTMPDEAVTLTGAWTTRTDIPYVIEYYQQNTEDDGYTLADTLNGEGAIGGSIPHREFEGFTETPDSVTAEGNARIRSDGSTVLKLYYDRDYYAVSFAYSGSAPEAAPALPDRANYRYGASITLPVIPGVVGGMSFSGWTAGNVSILGNTFSVPAQDTKIIGTWTQLFDSGDAPIPDAPVTPVTLEDNGTAYIIGYEDGAFRPDDYLTAKHETLMLSRLGLPVTSPSVAPELSAEERYITRKEFLGALLNASGAAAEDSEPMAEAAALGWISGYGDGGLYPEAYITRAQAVTIINRAFGRTVAQADSAQINYTDIPRDYWAYDAIMAASTTA